MTTSTAVDPAVADQAAVLLERLAGVGAVLREDQAAAISAVVAERRRVLVVQRTGFGKSAIYFIATRMLRDAGAGPTLVVSPLLALMRDQVAAAEAMGVRSVTINSTNTDEWAAIQHSIGVGEVDLVCVSPERLNHPGFVRNVLPSLSAGLGLLVVDEAHCISDWGHDFRPDYRRIRTAIDNLAPHTPVIATTATANARVTRDVADQLGDDVVVLRGPLDRDSLELGVVTLPSAVDRLAWIAQRLTQVPGTGIVYCLTVAQTDLVADFLQAQGIDAHAYSSNTPTEDRHTLETRFTNNQVKALVATSALGMGVDKADVAFVYHLGAPPSPIAYYQQVGRAGRAVERAEVVLLPSPEDPAIWSWFASVGLPDEAQVRRVLDALGDQPTSIPALETTVDVRRTRLETLLKILDVDGAVTRVEGGWVRTDTPWVYDHERVNRVRAARTAEADAMVAYTTTTGCLMHSLRDALDDPDATDCGRCWNCTHRPDPVTPDSTVTAAALAHLRGVEVVIDPRRQWARGLTQPKGNIRPGERAEPGRALCRRGDDGWWPTVDTALTSGGPTDDLVDGIFAALKRWAWTDRPTWVTWIPSTTHDHLLAALAARIATAGHLHHAPVLTQTRTTRPQADLHNSAHRLANVWDAFTVDLTTIPDPTGPVLVLDDTYDSGWTMTVTAAQLRAAGTGPVLPFVLARV